MKALNHFSFQLHKFPVIILTPILILAKINNKFSLKYYLQKNSAEPEVNRVILLD